MSFSSRSLIPLNLLLVFLTGNGPFELEVIGEVMLDGKPLGAEGEVDKVELRGTDMMLLVRST